MLRGLKILVAEDERGIRLLITRVLADAGAAVTAVASGSEAFQSFTRARPDVLLSDIRMPGGDGYELIRQVRALPAGDGGRTPAVAISASVGEDEVPKILASGFDRFIRKPFQAAELRAVVGAVAGRSPA